MLPRAVEAYQEIMRMQM
ncbi:hypothetical protein DT075_25185 [Bacillus licheniformis]|nr:hypothetical protein DT075_25185 [Bacillus licheniformis]